MVDDQELAIDVFPKGADAEMRVEEKRVAPGAASIALERPYLSRAIVAIDIRASQGRERTAAIHCAAGDRTPIRAVFIGKDGFNKLFAGGIMDKMILQVYLWG